MVRSLNFLAFVVVSSALAGAQVVQISTHVGTADPWANYFNSHKKLTFIGRVSGIARTKATSHGEDQITILVQNRNGGGISEVELGPKWYIDQQIAKVHLGDTVQVTGSKVMTKDRGIIIASQVVVNGQGGPVLTMRRLSGKAYWLPTEIAENTNKKASDPGNGDETETASLDSVNTMPEPPRVIQIDGGLVNVDTGPYWYGWQNQVIPVSRGLNIVNGPYPFFFRPF